jgi:hypothetical protein
MAQEKSVSPFEADRTRKSRSFDPEMSSSQAPSGTATATAAAEVNGAVPSNGVYPGNHVEPRNGAHQINGSVWPSEASPAITDGSETNADAGAILGQVVVELENNGHKMLASILETGSVVLQGAELLITISQPASMIGVLLGPEQKQLANAVASKAAGRLLKVNLVSGVVNGASAAARPARDGTSARSRAANDAVVQRMMEKFGAEIRTVIDHREKD